MKDELIYLKIETNEQLEKEVNDMISKGWRVDSIKIIDKYEVKMTKFSQKDQFTTFIPMLGYLEKRMLMQICKELGHTNYSNKTKIELIHEIEHYKKSYIISIYNKITKKNVEYYE